MTSVRRFAIAALAVVTACASAPGTAETSADGTAASRNADIITAVELSDPTVASGDLYGAIQRLRPRFLMTRGSVSSSNPAAGAVRVSMDGGALTSVDVLRSVRPAQIAEIRYLNAADATQRFGTNSASGGVILVKSR